MKINLWEVKEPILANSCKMLEILKQSRDFAKIRNLINK